MAYTCYIKPYRTPSELVSDLLAKRLSFHNQSAAEHLLSQISYYHFKIYLHPLIDSQSQNQKFYRVGEYFESGIELYRFDEALRLLMFRVIARLELKLRSRLDHRLSALSQDPFWYLDDKWFFRPSDIDLVRNRIATDFNRESEMYAKNFRAKYYNNNHDIYKFLPPFWIASELISFGQVYKIYAGLNYSYFNALPTPGNTILNSLATEFGAPNFKKFVNWIRCLRDVRNRCAHHSRLWNANLPAPGGINHLLMTPPTLPNRFYSTAVVTWAMIKALGISDLPFNTELLILFTTYPAAQTYQRSAGFPSNWNRDPFWN